ncbi:HlyC/CorC family transporter [bacterium]|nr:HlyC/CorC family transporter [bacterium]
MEEIVLSFAATVFFALMLYLASALEVAVFSLELSEDEKVSGLKRWLAGAMEHSGEFETFFITAKGLSLAALAVSNDIYFGYTMMDYSALRYLVEGAIFGIIAILAMYILPASVVGWNSSKTLKFAPLLKVAYIILYPIDKVAKVVLDFILRHSGLEGIKSLAMQRKLAYIADEGRYDIESEERQMIKQIIDFVETTVREVMVPRVDMVCAPIDAEVSDVIKIIEERGHSRIPLFQDKIDNIVGILYAKDLLIAMGKNGNSIDLSRICRKPYFIPESKLIDELLEEFRREKLHIAIVVDEYGGVAGMVTMEDLLEEIVGEIQDEYDEEEMPIQKLDDGVWRVMGKVTIDDVSNLLDTDLPSEEADTIGGLIYQLAGAIPKPGYSVELEDGILLIVEEIDGQRIKSIKVVKKSE